LDSSITLGVIQAKKLQDLDQSYQSLCIMHVDLFNQLSPHKLEQEVVDRSIAIADKVI